MLILASASNARHRLLQQARIPHKVIVSHFNENTIKKKNSIDLAQSLAKAKAEKVASTLSTKNEGKQINGNTLAILGCDSVFEFNGKSLGKPKSKEESLKRLLLMSGKSGFLHTGHTLILKKNRHDNVFNKVKNSVISTHIKFEDFTSEEIELYVNSEETISCAGGFTLEGEGSKFITSINGCYSNVIGISLPWLRKNIYKENI